MFFRSFVPVLEFGPARRKGHCASPHACILENIPIGILSIGNHVPYILLARVSE
jgi:hypothetical protein